MSWEMEEEPFLCPNTALYHAIIQHSTNTSTSTITGAWFNPNREHRRNPAITTNARRLSGSERESGRSAAARRERLGLGSVGLCSVRSVGVACCCCAVLLRTVVVADRPLSCRSVATQEQGRQQPDTTKPGVFVIFRPRANIPLRRG